ncbi:MAG: hypothetical protein H6582_11755 [Crocinitomicaceae bacterium]|nr:hypothetical protein [Crocinitomicaceae bacterium]
MKKTIFLFILLFVGFTSFSQEKKTLTATFDGYDGSLYTFMDLEDQVHLFNMVDASVKKNFDLNTDEYLYELFTVTYTEVKDGDGDVLLKIVGLEIQSTDDEDDED